MHDEKKIRFGKSQMISIFEKRLCFNDFGDNCDLKIYQVEMSYDCDRASCMYYYVTRLFIE